jgi:hypothetical protein
VARIIIPLKGLTTESVCNAQTCKKPRVNLKKKIGERATDETKWSPKVLALQAHSSRRPRA